MQTKSFVDSHILQVISKDPEHSPEAVKYKEMIQLISIHPRYQYGLATFISIFWFIITFNAMIGSFVFMNPLFECLNEHGSYEQKTQSEACKDIYLCKITNDFTAVAKTGLYCQKQSIRSTIQSIFALGLTIGMILQPIASDMIGRRKVIIFVFAIGVIAISTLLLSIQYNFEFGMVLGSLLTGIFGSGMTILGFILTCDFFHQKLRQKCLLIYCAMWGIGEMLFYFLYFYMPQWDKYLIFTLLVPTSALLIILLYLKIQSPVYALFVKKDLQLFKQILKSLKKYNKIQSQKSRQIISLSKQIIDLLQAPKSHSNSPRLLQTLKKIVTTKHYLVSCVCLMLALLSFNFFYYGMQGSMERTGFNFGLSMLLVGFNQFIAYLTASYFTKFIRRKIGAIVSVLATCCIGLLFILQAVKQQQVVQTVIAVLARIGSVYAYCFIILLQSQLLDIEIRSTAVAMIASIGEITRIIVPYIINFFNNLGIHIIIVSSILFLVFGTLPILALRQTHIKAQNENKEKIENRSKIIEENQEFQQLQ